MAKSAAQLLMERETRVLYGPVDLELFGYALEPGHSHLEAGRFVLHTPAGLRYSYCQGEGITICRDSSADLSEEQLWLNGSVYSAIASINGLLPVHASAVAHGGQVFAFTGPSGGGKSTLIAALGQIGLPMFCDDTLVLDLTDPGRIQDDSGTLSPQRGAGIRIENSKFRVEPVRPGPLSHPVERVPIVPAVQVAIQGDLPYSGCAVSIPAAREGEPLGVANRPLWVVLLIRRGS